MPRKAKSAKSSSFFFALPPQLKQQLRSQPKLELPVEPVAESRYTPRAADLLPTQPPSEYDDEEEHSVAAEVIPVLAPPAEPPAASTTVAQKRSASTSEPPKSKKRKGKAKWEDIDCINHYESHPWDCTGLVPRYAVAAEVPQALKKYFYQRHSLFPAYSRLPLLMDDTGWFSVTPASIAEHIADRCRCDVILDAFCGVGGNAIAFAQTCEHVIAMDNDITRLRLARHNALHHGVADRIEFVLADYVTWAQSPAGAAAKEAIDVVFLSPPWGGPEYLSVRASLDGQHPTYPLSAILPIPGDELFRITSPISPNIAYFLPRNVDMDELAALAAPLDASAKDGRTQDREWVEVEEEWVGDKLKAVTAYYGALVDGA